MSTTTVQRALGPMELQKVEAPVSTALKSIESWRGLVGRALGRVGWSQKRAAIEMGIPEAQLSRQLRGAEHLSFWRLHALPPEFWRELILLIVEFHDLTIGATEQDQTDQQIGRLVREAVTRCR
jgi:hypothetical protein